MNENVKLSDVLLCAFNLVISRNGDVPTEDGDFATCGVQEMILLEEAMCRFFDNSSDDLNVEDHYHIYCKCKQIDSILTEYFKGE